MLTVCKVRTRETRSWLDPQEAPYLAASLRLRLEERLKGEKAVMLALTYNRSKWTDPQELYEDARRLRHCARFIQRLSDVLGVPLQHNWVRKMEFQKGGWLHWHMIITGVDFIPHHVIEACWGHGYVWVQRVNDEEQQAGYFSKASTGYFAKAEPYPAWLMCQPSRSVKVISAAKGFWCNNEPGADYEINRSQSDQEPVNYHTGSKTMLGAALYRAKTTLMVSEHTIDDNGTWSHGTRAKFRGEFPRLLQMLNERGHGSIRSQGRWHFFLVDFTTLSYAARANEDEFLNHQTWRKFLQQNLLAVGDLVGLGMPKVDDVDPVPLAVNEPSSLFEVGVAAAEGVPAAGRGSVRRGNAAASLDIGENLCATVRNNGEEVLVTWENMSYTREMLKNQEVFLGRTDNLFCGDPWADACIREEMEDEYGLIDDEVQNAF